MRDVVLPRVVCAPMAGGPSTVDLACAVCEAGGLGFLAAGYLGAGEVAAQVAALRQRTDAPFGVNLFVVRDAPVDHDALARYVASLEPDARRFSTRVGEPVFDDDDFDAKLEAVVAARVPVVSFAFGCPPIGAVRALQAAGSRVWVTIARGEDAEFAAATGCDALVVQGSEAGGHRSVFDDDDADDPLDTCTLLYRVGRLTRLPLIAAGGIADGADARRAFDAGAVAVQAGTAFLLTPEAGTHPVHRRVVGSDRETRYTRAFSGRTARGIVNAFMGDHPDAPAAYPQIHHATAPIRAAARAAGDTERVNLWAGTRHHDARAVPAAEVVRALGE